jgi:hypothetical protein
VTVLGGNKTFNKSKIILFRITSDTSLALWHGVDLDGLQRLLGGDWHWWLVFDKGDRKLDEGFLHDGNGGLMRILGSGFSLRFLNVYKLTLKSYKTIRISFIIPLLIQKDYNNIHILTK